MILLIDNYDSFTYNLLHYLGELGAEIIVKRNDVLSVEEALALNPRGIVISPGPCDPDKSGICLDLIKQATGKIPIFGVCLGHQSIGQAFGGKIIKATKPMHGKVSTISNTGKGIFQGLPEKFDVTRYHSLIIERATLPECFDITSQIDGAKEGEGIIMGIEHKDHPIFGVQFHPESIVSQHGHEVLKNFLDICESK